jgi:hypothetical protein
MIRIFALVVALIPAVCLAQEQAVASRRILPEEVVQDSIWMARISTNLFVVRWTYTGAGATNMLMFNEKYEGKKVRLVIGSFESAGEISPFRRIPTGLTNYAQWKEGWLRRRTDKFFDISEEDAKKIVAGLKSNK